MKIDILNIEDTADGGAVVTVEVDRDYLHMALEQFLLQALKEKIDETFFEAATREVFEEDGLPSESNTDEEEDAFDAQLKEAARRLGELEQAVDGMDSNTKADWSGSFTYPHER